MAPLRVTKNATTFPESAVVLSFGPAAHGDQISFGFQIILATRRKAQGQLGQPRDEVGALRGFAREHRELVRTRSMACLRRETSRAAV
eukprot:76702-Pyramimonas_sp.AAC.1